MSFLRTIGKGQNMFSEWSYGVNITLGCRKWINRVTLARVAFCLMYEVRSLDSDCSRDLSRISFLPTQRYFLRLANTKVNMLLSALLLAVAIMPTSAQYSYVNICPINWPVVTYVQNSVSMPSSSPKKLVLSTIAGQCHHHLPPCLRSRSRSDSRLAVRLRFRVTHDPHPRPQHDQLQLHWAGRHRISVSPHSYLSPPGNIPSLR